MNTSPSPLICTPAPQPHESLHGYVLRVCEANGYISPKWLMQHANLTAKQCRLVRPPLSSLAKIMACSEEKLAKISYGKHSSGELRSNIFTVNGHDLLKLDLDIKKCRICPECIIETGAISLAWSLRISIACPTHGRLAIYTCPSCKADLSFNRRGVLKCNCNYSFDQSPTETVSSHAALALLKAIHNKLYNLPISDDQVALHGFPIEFFETISLRNLLSIVEKVRLRVPSTENRARNSRSISIQSLHEVATAFADWPNGFYQFIENTGDPKDIKKHTGLSTQFFGFYQSFVKDPNLPDEVSSFFKETFFAFGDTYWKKGVIGRYDGLSPRERTIVGINGLAEHMNVQKDTAIKLVEMGIITPVASAGGHTKKQLFDLSEDLPQRISKGRSLGEREAAFRLGIPVSVLKILRDQRIIELRHIGATLASFHEFDIKEFNDRFISYANPKIPTSKTEQHFTIENAMRINTGSAQHKADLITAILDGKIRSKGRTGKNVGSVILCEPEVRSFFRQLKIEKSNTLLASEVAKLLHCDSESVLSLVSQGILMGQQQGQGIRVYEDSVKEFNENYVSNAEVALRLKTSAKSTLQICKAYNIDILYADRGKGKPKQPFIPRDALSIFGL